MPNLTTTPTRRNSLPFTLILVGALAAIIGAIALVNAWHAASLRVFTDSLYGMQSSHWTTGVVTSIVILALGVILLILGVAKWERHPEQGPLPPD